MTLISLVEKGRLTKEEAAEEINMEVEAFEKLMKENVNLDRTQRRKREI